MKGLQVDTFLRSQRNIVGRIRPNKEQIVIERTPVFRDAGACCVAINSVQEFFRDRQEGIAGSQIGINRPGRREDVDLFADN